MTSKTRDDLPELTAEEAEQRGYWTLQQFAAWAGLALSTVYNLAGEPGFPEPVASVPSTGPNPHLVRDREASKAWAQARPQRLRGEWTDTAEQITRRRATRDEKVLSLTDVCAATGLKPDPLWSDVRRTGTTTAGPKAHLVRPAYRVGQTPYWSQQQLDDYITAKMADGARRAGIVAGLPEMSRADADEQGMLSINALAVRAGLSKGTMHRYARLEGFPAVEAVVPSNGPHPWKVRPWAKVEEWLRARLPEWQPPFGQDALD